MFLCVDKFYSVMFDIRSPSILRGKKQTLGGPWYLKGWRPLIIIAFKIKWAILITYIFLTYCIT